MKSLKVERKFVSWFCCVCPRRYDQLAHDNIEKKTDEQTKDKYVYTDLRTVIGEKIPTKNLQLSIKLLFC